jgi:hypothetical protein
MVSGDVNAILVNRWRLIILSAATTFRLLHSARELKRVFPLNPSGKLSIFLLFFFVCSHNPSTASRSGEQKNQKKAAAGLFRLNFELKA